MCPHKSWVGRAIIIWASNHAENFFLSGFKSVAQLPHLHFLKSDRGCVYLQGILGDLNLERIMNLKHV